MKPTPAQMAKLTPEQVKKCEAIEAYREAFARDARLMGPFEYGIRHAPESALRRIAKKNDLPIEVVRQIFAPSGPA